MSRRNNQSQKGNNSKNDAAKNLSAIPLNKLSPQQLAVITALLTNTLTVDSILIDKDQQIQIILGGSIRRKTKMDKLLDEMSGLTIGDLLDSIIIRGK